MKRTALYMALVFALLCSCSRHKASHGEATGEGMDSVPMLVMQVKKCSRLYTAEYNIHKIVTHDDIVRLKGNVLSHDFNIRIPLGDRKVAIPMDVTLKAYIDFEGFSEKNVRRSGRRITVVLPDPKVALTGSKVDHKNTKEFVALTRSRFSDAEMADFERQGRASVIAAIPRMGIIATARDNAARVLIPMLVQMGYEEKDITVTFRKEFGERDISTLLDKTTIEK